jgi:uncharacterized protein
MRTWIAKWPVVSFCVITLTLSWGYWLALLAQGQHVVPRSAVTHFPGLLGPMLAAIVVTAAMGGRKALQELFGRMVQLGPLWPSRLTLALSPLALGACALLAMAILGQPLPSADAFARFPGLPQGWTLGGVIVVVFLVDGFGEETGWRGFLLERLLSEHGRLQATLWVALLWSLWHLPLFWLDTSMEALRGPVFFGWLFALVCGSFVLAHVYLATGHSVLCVALWHTGYNMMAGTETGTGLPAAIIGTAVMVWGSIVAVQWWPRADDRPRVDPQPEPVPARRGSAARRR